MPSQRPHTRRSPSKQPPARPAPKTRHKSNVEQLRQHAAEVDALMQQECMKVDQTAFILGIDRSGVTRMLQSGELSGFRVGKQWRIRPSAIRALGSPASALQKAG